jgi:hypothetical protein
MNTPPSPIQLLNAWTNRYETLYVYHGTWAHLNSVVHKSLPSVCVSVCVSLFSSLANCSVNTFPRQQIHATMGLLDASFSVRLLSYQRRVCESVYPLIVSRYRLGKDVPAAVKNCWRRRFLLNPCRIKSIRTRRHTSEARPCLQQIVLLSWRRDVAFSLCDGMSVRLLPGSFPVTWPGRRNLWFCLQNLHYRRIQSRSKARGVCEASQFPTALFIANVPLCCVVLYMSMWKTVKWVNKNTVLVSGTQYAHLPPRGTKFDDRSGWKDQDLLSIISSTLMSGIQSWFSIHFLDIFNPNFVCVSCLLQW